MGEEALRQLVLVSGGVRETIFAQPVVRALPGAAVLAPPAGIPTLLGLDLPLRVFPMGSSAGSWMGAWWRLRGQPLDLAVLPPPVAGTRAALAYFAAVPRRLMVRGAHGWWASEQVTVPATVHPVVAGIALAAAIPTARLPHDPSPIVRPSPAARSRLDWRLAAAGIRPSDRSLLLIPGGGNWVGGPMGRLWPAERFAILANQLDVSAVLLVSGQGDGRIVRETATGLRVAPLVLDLRQVSAEDLAAAALRSLGAIGHDGDALHVAAAAQVPVIGLLNPRDIGPYGSSFTEIRVEDLPRLPARGVVELAQELLPVPAYA